MSKTENETILIRMLIGALLILGGISTYTTWISYPAPKDFWGSIFMNFGAVYPVAGIIGVLVGIYIILTTDYPQNKKESSEFLGFLMIAGCIWWE